MGTPSVSSINTDIYHSFPSLIEQAQLMGCNNIHITLDAATHLCAIVVIHSLKRGPAIGGCRHLHYDHPGLALRDAIALAQMMTYKAAVNDLPHGGAKAVLIHPPHLKDRKAYFHAFGQFLNQLGGRYITAPDSNTSNADMDLIAEVTPHVLCTSQDGNPAEYTARGVRRSIQAALSHQRGSDSLQGIHVAVQGVGAVGLALIQELLALGAQVSMADINAQHLHQAINLLGRHNVTVVDPQDILSLTCDVLAPCALGGIINPQSLSQLRTAILAGAANNQLSQPELHQTLHENNILYIPDFLCNSGGLIFAASCYKPSDEGTCWQQVDARYDQVLNILDRARSQRLTPTEVCDQIVQERLQ